MATDIQLSFVVPLYNEEEVAGELFERLKATMSASNFECEVVLVDDGSDDSTPEKIATVCREDRRFRGVVLSRNFGHQSAVSAGLRHARGASVGVIDGDLQDPPESILDFHAKLAEGYDVVYAVRRSRKENVFKRFCYWLFYRSLRKLSSIDMPLDAGDFCLMSRRVVDELNSMPERHRFIRGMRSWVGFRQVGVPCVRDPRTSGRSKYTLGKLLLLATDGILTFSETPLRIATGCGAFVASIAFLWGVYIFAWRIFGNSTELAGFATLACGMFFLGGIQLLCLGILGEYIARIHNEVKRRPLYVIERRVGFDPGEDSGT